VAALAPIVELPSSVAGRYTLYDEIAAGGMATVHYGRLNGAGGFSRTVAIKRMHPGFARDPEFVDMFLTEARLAARIRHPNVVQTLDVIATGQEILLVLEYVLGESLSQLRRAMIDTGRAADPRVVAAIMGSVLRGLHAAHEAKREDGVPLDIVHRDVSPQNVLVGADGLARVIDFGVAKAIGRAQTTRQGQIKGKLAYMPPEQLRGEQVTRRCDVYAAAVVTWEFLTRERLFRADHEAALVNAILSQPIAPPSRVAAHVPASFDRVILRGLARDPEHRYATAREMALDLERCVGVASAAEVGEWVESLVGPRLSQRAAKIAEIEGVAMEAERAARSALEKEADGYFDISHVAITPAITRPSSSTLRPKLRRARLVLCGTAVLAFGLLLALVRGRAATGSQAALSSSDSSHPANPQSATAPATSSAPDILPPISAIPPPVVTAVADAGAQPTRLGSPPVRPSAPRTRSRGECDTPFTVDARGHKHYKEACL
jgi:serine/threonine-protein kinase